MGRHKCADETFSAAVVLGCSYLNKILATVFNPNSHATFVVVFFFARFEPPPHPTPTDPRATRPLILDDISN